jgi:RND family efflux transporter MFP subunit
VDEASAQADLARRALESAEARRDLLAKVARDADAGAVASQVINAPASGILRSIQALAGETVATGTNLFEILVLDELWLRVPVYVGDLDLIEAGAKANVETLTNRPSSVVLPAKPVMAPPSANPQAATVDLYFDLGPGVKGFVPGQRVAASLTLKGKTKILVVPSSAVVYDIHGGTWVYEQSEPLRYTRRRVVIDRVAGDQAVVASGLAEGSKIVVAGAAELFGTEVGFAK